MEGRSPGACAVSPGGGPGNLTFTTPMVFVGGAIHFQLYDAAGSAGTGWGLITANGGIDLSGATANSITAFWGGGTNGPGTLFLAQISTDGCASVNSVQQTTGIFATFGGLTANTPYNFRAAALGAAGTLSAAGLPRRRQALPIR